MCFNIEYSCHAITNIIHGRRLSGHSMSNHPMVETVPPQILMKIYTFGLYGQKRRFAK